MTLPLLIGALSRSTETLLIMAGWSVVLICIGLIIVPYLMRRTDLVTAWNCVLCSCAINIGIACLEAVDRTKSFYERYLSFDFPDADYRDVLFRDIFFFVILLTMFYVVKLFKKFGAKRFLVNPVWSGTLLVNTYIVCAIFVASVSFVTIPFFQEVALNLSQKGAVFASVFAFYAWYQKRGSLSMLLIALFVMAIAALFCIKISPGRRLLLTVLAAPSFVAYWVKWRYSNPYKVLVLSAVGASVIIVGGLSYSLIRRFDTHGKRLERTERTYANIVQRLSKIDMEGITSQISTWKQTLAQRSFEYSLLAKRVMDSGNVEVHTLNTLQFVTCYAIPRRLWANKPKIIAIRLPREYLGLKQKSVWGVGLAGHSYYEGGYWALTAYATVLILLVRLIDEPLKRSPNNPFFIATVTASFAYLVNILRGDLGTHFNETLECFLFALILNWSARLWCESRPGAYETPLISAANGPQNYT